MRTQLLVAKAVAYIPMIFAVTCACARGEDILRTPDTRAATEFRFSPTDDALLDEIERACFLYFWKEVGTPAQLVKDRKLAHNPAAHFSFPLENK